MQRTKSSVQVVFNLCFLILFILSGSCTQSVNSQTVVRPYTLPKFGYCTFIGYHKDLPTFSCEMPGQTLQSVYMLAENDSFQLFVELDPAIEVLSISNDRLVYYNPVIKKLIVQDDEEIKNEITVDTKVWTAAIGGDSNDVLYFSLGNSSFIHRVRLDGKGVVEPIPVKGMVIGVKKDQLYYYTNVEDQAIINLYAWDTRLKRSAELYSSLDVVDILFEDGITLLPSHPYISCRARVNDLYVPILFNVLTKERCVVEEKEELVNFFTYYSSAKDKLVFFDVDDPTGAYFFSSECK